MSTDVINSGRRKFLTAATSAVGVAGVVGIAVPFVGSWNPSAKAKAAGAPVNPEIVTGIAIPVVVIVAALGVRHIRQLVQRAIT